MLYLTLISWSSPYSAGALRFTGYLRVLRPASSDFSSFILLALLGHSLIAGL